MFGEKPNIAAEFIIRAHFQLMCQFGKARLVWNKDRVEKDFSMAADRREGGPVTERKIEREKNKE